MKVFALTALLGSASALGCEAGMHVITYRDPFCQQRSATYNLDAPHQMQCQSRGGNSQKYTCSEFGLEIENYRGYGCHTKISETFFAWDDCYQYANGAYVKYTRH